MNEPLEAQIYWCKVGLKFPACMTVWRKMQSKHICSGICVWAEGFSGTRIYLMGFSVALQHLGGGFLQDFSYINVYSNITVTCRKNPPRHSEVFWRLWTKSYPLTFAPAKWKGKKADWTGDTWCSSSSVFSFLAGFRLPLSITVFPH